jgi:hypothetical protein
MNEHHHHDDTDITGDVVLSEKEKLHKLLGFWIKHNEDHAKTYREWSEKAENAHLGEIKGLLEEAFKLTLSINTVLREATEKLGHNE